MSPEAEINGARLWYDQTGDGLPLVLLHAGIADSRMWDGHFDRFATEHKVVAYDRRGFGLSAIPGGPFSSVHDHEELLRLLGVEGAIHIGCSNGASVSLQVALHAPELVSGLILVGPGLDDHEWSEEMQSSDNEEEEAFERGDFEGVLAVTMRTWVAGPQRELEDVDIRVRERVRKMMHDAYSRQHPAFMSDSPPTQSFELEPPVSARLGELTVPVLVIVGELDIPDMLVCADRLSREIPGAEKVVMPGVAHLPNMEAPEEFDALVTDFLRRLRG